MTWFVLTLISALILGTYEFLKKRAVDGNAVLPVLFFAVFTSAALWLIPVIWAVFEPARFEAWELIRPARDHALLFAKAALVGTSWVLGYFGLKHLPISIAAPIRATGPLWTITFAVTLYGETPGLLQWAGVAVILISFFAFSLTGRLEGIRFERDGWVLLVIASSILSATSSLYDKYLLQVCRLKPSTVQAWFSLYLFVYMLPYYILWKKRLWKHGDFEWRWSIPLIALALLAADFAYFTAIAQPGALIAVITPLRRTSLLVTFALGVRYYREKNVTLKAACCLGILLGVALVSGGT